MVVINHTVIMDGLGAMVTVEGPLNGNAAVDLDEYITALIQKGIRGVCVDAGGMEYISSAGIGAVLLINKKLQSEGGTLALFALNEEAATIFKLLGFDREMIVALDKDEALHAMPRPKDTVPKGREELPAVTPLTMKEPAAPVPAEVPGVDTNDDIGWDEQITVAFENPIVVECQKCGALVRVRQSGDYACPECSAEFTVKKDMSVTY